jgi:hypothetical protein
MTRTVSGTKCCLEHNIGLGGAAVVTVYQRAYGEEAPKVGAYSLEDDGRCRLGYNPAAEARVIRLIGKRSNQRVMGVRSGRQRSCRGLLMEKVLRRGLCCSLWVAEGPC